VGNYAYIGNGPAMDILDISNPNTPARVGRFITQGMVRDICVSGNYAYIANYDKGLRVIDISNPAAPTEAGFYDTPGYAYGVDVSGGYAYVADDHYGLRIIDISNPAAPTEAGFYDTAGETYGVYVYSGYAYVVDYYSGLRIIDISNPATPTKAGACYMPWDANGVFVSGGYAYVADGNGGLRIIDISNPAAPSEAGFYVTPGNARGVYFSGGYIYIADRDIGLLILHNDLATPLPNLVDLQITQGIHSIQLEFGLESEATNGIDATFGELELPPKPSAGTFDVRFTGPLLGNGLLKDLRNSGESAHEWVVDIQRASTEEVTLTWGSLTDIAGVFLLQDAITGTLINVDMKTTSQYTITNTAITQLKILYNADKWEKVYGQKWSMVSLGLDVPDKTVAGVFPSAISAFKYDAGYQSVTSFEAGKGYWVNLSSGMNQTAYGPAISELTLALPQKWSMIGALSCSVSVADFVQAPPNNIVSIYAFNGTQYVPVYPGGSGVLEQGKGYWINMGASGSIQMSAPSGTGKVLAAVSAQPELLRGSTEIPITITASGTNQTVSFYLVEHAPWEEKLNQTFELPPPSPLGMLDVRIFGENSNGYRSLVVDSQGDFTKTITLTVPEGSKGIEANWKNDSLVRGACLLSDGRQTVDMAEVNRITVDGNTKQLTLIYSGEGTEASPMAYSLQANYPNPFNPETTIPYTIKDAGMVELTVFNVLGQEVKRLVYEVKQPGIHSTRWDGTDAYGKLVSGGIYLYRMSVNGFIETRKMLLMK
jgi:hypothetical protein